MSSDARTSPVLDCADSPLSITGNVIGILTLAYAILITLWYRSKTLVRAKDESRKFYIRAERVHSSLVQAQKRLEAYFSTLNLNMNPEIESLLEDARYWDTQYQRNLQIQPELKLTLSKAEMNRQALAMKTDFILAKEDMDKVVEGMLQTRATLDGTYQVLLNSMIVDEIRQQKSVMEVQSQSLSKQRAMITHIMGALNLEFRVDSTSEDPISVDATPQAEPSRTKIPVDMSEMYLRPPDEENKKRPPPKPACSCGQSHSPDQSGDSSTCSDPYGEAYFDVEGGVWKRPSPPGHDVYFDQDRGSWIEVVISREPISRDRIYINPRSTSSRFQEIFGLQKRVFSN